MTAESESETEPRAGEPAFFFSFVRVAYERFLAEDDAKVDELKASVAAAFGDQHAIIQRDIAQRRADNERVRAELQALKAQAVSMSRCGEAGRGAVGRQDETLWGGRTRRAFY